MVILVVALFCGARIAVADDAPETVLYMQGIEPISEAWEVYGFVSESKESENR